MSEEANVNAAPVVEVGETAGQLLRKAREASGLHVAALAVAMKVPVKKLEALEADRFADLPDAVFVRALAASVCRTLKVDAAPILSKLPASTTPRFEQRDQGVHMPTKGQGLFQDTALAAMLKKPPLLAVLALLLAALAVAFWPDTSTQSSNDATATENAPVMPPVPPPNEPTPQNTAITGANGAGLAPNVPPEPVPAASVPTAPAPASVDSAAKGSLVTFQASASAWVRVSDSQGAVLFEKTLAAGETAGASGALPLSVVVGNVEATAVEVRGQPFALDAVSKNNVARFEVK